MLRDRRTVRWAVLLAMILSGCTKAGKPTPNTPGESAGKVIEIKPGPNVQDEFQAALINAKPGETIQLGEGAYEFTQGLSLAKENVTIRGKGMDKTVLSFKKQETGKEGLLVKRGKFLIEDLTIEDTKGDAVKVEDVEGVTFRRVRAQWTGGSKESNGAYGLYPVQCKNVLIEECVAIGASDAGIYVGQSQNIIVRRCRAKHNVAGIEIENSIDADVYDNVATENAGGLLVFDLPGLQVKNGKRVRVFNNQVFANNHDNFAPKGNIVASVAPGTGVMVMATDQVEVFQNTIKDNHTYNMAIVSFLITGKPIEDKDKDYDPIPESIFVHDNQFSGGGANPRGERGVILAALVGKPVPDILYDGYTPSKGAEGKPVIFLKNNGSATFVNLKWGELPDLRASKSEKETKEKILLHRTKLERDPKKYEGEIPALLPVKFQESRDAAAVRTFGLQRPMPEGFLGVRAAPRPGRIGCGSSETTAVAPTETDWQPPEQLSAFALFQGNGSTQEPVDGVIPYDITTPLFSDYAIKYRFVRIPAGASVEYHESDVFDFPVGTVIAKTFAYMNDLSDPAKGRRLIETRLLIHRPEGWIGLPYVWSDDQAEAKLQITGGTRNVRWVHTDGRERHNKYLIPNVNQCLGCHENRKVMRPIGPKARNLNKDFAYPEGSENQLSHWTRVGLLRGTTAPEQAPRLPVWNDPATGTLDQRARAYLETNCAHCHNPDGPARTSGLDLMAAKTDPYKWGVWKTPVAAGRGSGGRSFDIVPGKSDQSILLYRLESTETGVLMPELSRRLVDEEGLALIRDWVANLSEPVR